MDVLEKGKIFVGGLSWDTTDESLSEYFSQFGVVIGSTVMKKTDNGRSRGFGFVTFADESTVDIVLNGCPHFLDGRTIDPKLCNPRLLNQPKKPIGFKIFLGGLPSHVTQTDLRKAFEKFGNVLDVVIMYDQIRKKSRGFGFLTFENIISAEIAINSHYLEIDGRRIEIKRTQPRGTTQRDLNTNGSQNNGINQTAEQLLMHLPINPCQVMPDCLTSNTGTDQNLQSHVPPPSVSNTQQTHIPWRIPTKSFNNMGLSVQGVTASSNQTTSTVTSPNVTNQGLPITNTSIQNVALPVMQPMNALVPTTNYMTPETEQLHNDTTSIVSNESDNSTVQPNFFFPNWNLQTVNLQPINLQPVNLQPVNLQPVNLQPVNLQPVNLQPVNLQPVNLQPVSLQPVNLQPVNLQPVSLQPAHLQPTHVQMSSLQPGNIQPVNYAQLKPMILPVPNLQLPNDFSFPMVHNFVPQHALLTVPNHCNSVCLPSVINVENQWVHNNNNNQNNNNNNNNSNNNNNNNNNYNSNNNNNSNNSNIAALNVCPTIQNIQQHLRLILGQVVGQVINQSPYEVNGQSTCGQGINNGYINNLTLNFNCDCAQATNAYGASIAYPTTYVY